MTITRAAADPAVPPAVPPALHSAVVPTDPPRRRTSRPSRAGLAFAVAVAIVTPALSTAPAAADTASAISTWGANDLGQLGNGTTTGRTQPGPGPSIPDVVTISGGRGHVLGLRSDGSVVAWGENDYGELGDGTTTNRTSPIVVSGLPAVTGVFTGHYHSMAITADGALYAWGLNNLGQLGVGDTTMRTRPTRVSVPAPLTAADGGADHTVALGADGTVWAWGANANGEVGDGTTTRRTTPVHLTAPTGVVLVAAARNSSYAVTSSGALYSWGRNDYGQLGLGDTTDRSRPTLVTRLSGVTSISAGAFHAVALLSDGSVHTWGFNSYGNLGDGTTTRRNVPVTVSGLAGVTLVETGRDYSFAVTADGVLHAWGRNDFGQLGDGTTTNRLSPVTVSGVVGPTSIGAGRDYTAVLVPGSADTDPPTTPGTPTAASNSPGTVTATWTASVDDHATTLTYAVFRDGGSTAIGSVASASTTTVSYTDTGLVGGSTHTYAVRASDGVNWSALSPPSDPVTVQSGPPAVLSDDFSGGLTAWSSTNLTLDSTRYPSSGSAPSVRGATTGAPAYATRALPSAYSSLCGSVDVDLSSLSTTVVLLRFRSAAAGVARVFVTSAGYLSLRADVSGQTVVSATRLPLGSWHQVQLCTTVSTSAAISVSLDGVRVLSTTSSTGAAPISVLQLGDTAAVTAVVNYDDVVVTN